MLSSIPRSATEPKATGATLGYLQILYLELFVPNTYSKSSFQEVLVMITFLHQSSDICQFYCTL